MINSYQNEVLSQTAWSVMLGRDEQMQPGFVDFQNFAQGLVLLVGRLFLGQRV